MILLDCPSLGKRPTTEFAYGGEYIPHKPKASSPFDKWVDYAFFLKKIPKVRYWNGGITEHQNSGFCSL